MGLGPSFLLQPVPGPGPCQGAVCPACTLFAAAMPNTAEESGLRLLAARWGYSEELEPKEAASSPGTEGREYDP